MIHPSRAPTEWSRSARGQAGLGCNGNLLDSSECRCRRGHKHGPFYYFVQCHNGRIRKSLLKTTEQRQKARESIAAYVQFQKQLDELSNINTELLRRGEFKKN